MSRPRFSGPPTPAVHSSTVLYGQAMEALALARSLLEGGDCLAALEAILLADAVRRLAREVRGFEALMGLRSVRTPDGDRYEPRARS